MSDRRTFLRGVITAAAAGAVTLATDAELLAFAQPGTAVDVTPANVYSEAEALAVSYLPKHAYVLIGDTLHYAGHVVEVTQWEHPGPRWIDGIPRVRRLGSMRVELWPKRSAELPQTVPLRLDAFGACGVRR